MGNRAAMTAIVAVTFVLWMGSRSTAIALPLVALAQTGDAWTTGLVAGTQAVAVLTAGWWGRGLRERVTDGPAIAAVMAVKALGLAVVPVSAGAGGLGVAALVACGLVVGLTSALDRPAVRALLSDIGDRLGPGHAARALTWQDLAHRSTMFLAPPLAALAVGRGHTVPLLWAECGAVLCGAAVLTLLPRRPHSPRRGPGTDPGRPGATIRAVLRRHPRMAASIAAHATVSATWFAFSLGLAILGARTGRPGELIAAGMSGYGLASTATSFAAPWLVNRVPPWPAAVLPIPVLGAVFAALPAHVGSAPLIALLAAAGPDRRAGFAADQIADGGASALGMLVGGAVIGILGAGATLVGAGLVQIAAVVALIAARPTAGRCGPRPAPPGRARSTPTR